MSRKLPGLFIAFLLYACSSGPEEVDVTFLDAGPTTADASDGGRVDSGTTAVDAGDLDGGPDGGVVDSGTTASDAGDLDGGIVDTGTTTLDGGPTDGGPDDGGPDGGAPFDSGPIELVEDFTDPANEIFTCPGGTDVLPGLQVENGTQCLGIDGSGCPAERGLPGPDDVACSDPAHNPFVGAGQCISDFFACFDPSGTCSNDGMGTFTWGNGATQVIQVDANGALIQSAFYPSTSTVPCVLAVPETMGGTRVIYTLQ